MLATLKARFEAKIRITPGCWEWVACVGKSGYGEMFGHEKRELAHRVSYELYVGKIPAGEGFHGTCVLHKCDNRRCVNPEHLFLGTPADNIRDMERKGRSKHPSLQSHGRAKLTENDVLRIRDMAQKNQLDIPRMASELKVSKTAVRLAAQHKSWRSLCG